MLSVNFIPGSNCIGAPRATRTFCIAYAGAEPGATFRALLSARLLGLARRWFGHRAFHARQLPRDRSVEHPADRNRNRGREREPAKARSHEPTQDERRR